MVELEILARSKVLIHSPTNTPNMKKEHTRSSFVLNIREQRILGDKAKDDICISNIYKVIDTKVGFSNNSDNVNNVNNVIHRSSISLSSSSSTLSSLSWYKPIKLLDENKKKLLVFCLFNNKEVYNYGTLLNYELAKKVYPEWMIRIYFNSTANNKLIKHLETLDLELVEIDLPYNPMFYRLFPIFDPDVECFISRDLDSIIGFREAAMVKEWYQGSWKLHLIHEVLPGHRHPIMGGMFGFKICDSDGRPSGEDLQGKIYKYYQDNNRKGFRYLDDQHFFNKYFGKYLNVRDCLDHNKTRNKSPWSRPFNGKHQALSSIYKGVNEGFVGHRVKTKELYLKHFKDPLV